MTWARPSREWGSLSIPFLAYLAYGVVTSRYGLAVDSDSQSLFDAGQAILAGHYLPSRSSGFPAFEFLIAAVLRVGGGTLEVNLLSLLFGIAALLIGATVLPRGGRQLWVWSFLTSQVLLTNASASMETNLNVMLCVLWIWATGVVEPGERRWAVAVGVLLVLTRIDSAALIVVTCLASAIHQRTWRPIRTLLIVGLTSLALYSLLNGGLGFLGLFQSTTEAPFRRLSRAAVGVICLLWTTGFAVVGHLFVRRSELSRYQVSVLAGLTLLGLARFWLLADELEYLLPWYLGLLLISSSICRQSDVGWILAVSLIGVCCSPALFVRPDTTKDEYAIRPSIESPGWLQDAERRRAQQNLSSPSFWAWVERGATVAVEPSAHNEFLLGRDGRSLVVFSAGLYVLQTDRYVGVPGLQRSKAGLIVCEGALRQNYGWRQARKRYSEIASERFDAGESLQCAQKSHSPE
jgi:hypothetical protein